MDTPGYIGRKQCFERLHPSALSKGKHSTARHGQARHAGQGKVKACSGEEAANLKDVSLGDLLAALAHSDNGRLVHEVHQLCPRGASSGTSHLVEVYALLQLLVPCMHRQDTNAPLHTPMMYIDIDADTDIDELLSNTTL